MLFGEEGKLFSLQQQNEGCKTIQNLVDKKILLLQENSLDAGIQDSSTSISIVVKFD